MKRNVFTVTRRGLAFLCVLFLCGSLVLAQTAPPLPPPGSQPVPQPNAQPLAPDQLDNLVAPIALYPDPLLGQVLAASTYPLELVEVQQWLAQNRNLSGTQLMDAARQQNWDPSVQALVAFPDALALLNRDIRWTTDLGNAYLGQQNDVMAAIQRLRLRADQNGRLASTPQQTVTTQVQNGQSAIVIEPASPQVIYVPVYSPEYIWGPPAWGYYPPLWYPSIGFGFGFGPGIFLSGFFPGWGGWGWGGWGPGWGWGCGWFGGGLYVNNFFFNHYGFHGYYNGGFYRGTFPAGGREAWTHDPYHRAGIGYANRNVATRYNNARYSAGRFNRGYQNSAGAPRGFSGAPAARSFSRANQAPSNQAGMANRGFSGRGYSGSNYGRTYSGPSSGQNFNRGGPAPSNNRGYSGQGFSGGPRSYAAPHSNGGFGGGSRSFGGGASVGGGHSGGGGGGRSLSGGGGHSFGGGGHSGGGRR